MIITAIICSTIVACILILAIYADRINKRENDNNTIIDSLQRDIEEIFYVTKTISLDNIYGETKDKIAYIARLSGAYCEEVNNIVENVINKSTKES